MPPPQELVVLLADPAQASGPHRWEMLLLSCSLGRVLVCSAFGSRESFLVVFFYHYTAQHIYSTTA